MTGAAAHSVTVGRHPELLRPGRAVAVRTASTNADQLYLKLLSPDHRGPQRATELAGLLPAEPTFTVDCPSALGERAARRRRPGRRRPGRRHTRRPGRYNPNCGPGDPYGGAHDLAPSYLFRSLPGQPSHQTPIANLFMLGAGTWPGHGVNGNSGYIVAQKLLA